VVTLNSPTQINIAWTNTATNATGIMINRKVGANGVLTTVATLPPTATSYNDTNVTPGTLYEYHVQSFNISGNNDFSGVSVTSLPAAPTGVTAIGGNNENTISWQPVTGAVSYNIYRATVSGGETSVALATNLTTTSFSDTGLPLNSTYYYEVTAVDAGGEGPRSSEVHGTTTNVSALQVVSTTPAKGATGVSRSAPITVTFNESVNFVTVSGSTFTLTPTAGGPAVTATVTYTDSNFTATLTPSAILSPNTQYTVTLSSLIQDEFNDPLATYSWTFTTGS
jgi:fibronectin type 3 domain-containing protein